MKLRTFVLASLGALALAACGQSGTYYEKSPEAVMKAIEKVSVPTAMMGRSISNFRVSRPLDDTVLIVLTDMNGKELYRIVNQVEADGNGSRVITQAQTPDGKALDANLGGQQANMMNQFTNEIVKSAIEGRSFDMMFATSPAAKAMLGNDPEMQATIDEANKAMLAISKMEQTVEQIEFEQKYGDDWGKSAGSKSDGWAE
jgi:hypothetical protein